ncbi:MAG: hypothetical protein IKW00_00750 [Clostridia bacterium]|nr:hypothetical protein [Clostridia bacterium]
MIQDVFGLPVNLASPFDFSFLGRYGRPFCVFYAPASGTVSFGTESREYGRLLCRFAGAPMEDTWLTPGQAADNLRNAAPLYTALRHKALPQLLGQGEVAGGYMLLFRWPEGENISSAEVKKRLRHQPLIARLQLLDRVFDFHLHCANQGYTAVGFDSEKVMYDFATGETTVFDIDLYAPAPAVNTIGQMPGSARFRSPEEYEPGAPIDSLTVQYNMAALAFDVLGRDGLQYADCWTASPALYAVAARAMHPDRGQRYPGIGAFLYAWRDAVKHSTVY